MIEAINDRKKLERDRDRIDQAFSDYQIVETLIAVNAGKKHKGRKFKAYLKDVGLKDLLRSNSKVTDIEKAKEKAENNVIDAVKMFSRR